MSVAPPDPSPKGFHRVLPQKARISIFNGQKELEHFINEDSEKRSEMTESRRSNMKSQYLLGCQSIYENFTVKKSYRGSFVSKSKPSTIISVKRIREMTSNNHRSNKSIFSSVTRRNNKVKKLRFQYFLKNNLIDFDKIQKLYFETKNESSKIEKIPPYFLEVVEVFSLNSIIKEFKAYYDFYPLLNLRRVLTLLFGLICWVCIQIVKSAAFKLLFNLLVMLDCTLVAIDFYHSSPKLETAIIILYNLENLFKILGFGLFFSHNSFFRIKWNVLDFTLNLLIDALQITFTETGFRLRLLSAVRFLKLLKIPPIQVILVKMGSTLWLLAETFTIVLWFIIFYAIWGLQLFSGLLKHVCVDAVSGIQTEVFCGNSDYECPGSAFCSKGLSNPDFGVSNYDNLLTASLQVFKIITTDDWTSSMFIIRKTLSRTVWIYYVSLVVFGNFFMMNLILAVLKVKYGQNETTVVETNEENKLKVYDLKDLKEKRIIISRNRNGTRRKLETPLAKINTDSKVLQVKSIKRGISQLNIQKRVSLHLNPLSLRSVNLKKRNMNPPKKSIFLLFKNSVINLYQRAVYSTRLNPLDLIKRSQLEVRVKSNLRYESPNVNDVLPKRKEDLLNFIHHIVQLFKENTHLHPHFNIQDRKHFLFNNKLSQRDFQGFLKSARKISTKEETNPVYEGMSKAFKPDNYFRMALRAQKPSSHLIILKQAFRNRLMQADTRKNRSTKEYTKNELIVTRKNQNIFMRIVTGTLYNNSSEGETKRVPRRKRGESTDMRLFDDEIDGEDLELWDYEQFTRKIKEKINNQRAYKKPEDLQERFYRTIFNDLKNQAICGNSWSGGNVLIIPKNSMTLGKIFNSLNSKFNYQHFADYKTMLGKITVFLKKASQHSIFIRFSSFLVLANAIILCLEGISTQSVLDSIQTVLLFFYIIEVLVKITVLSVKKYLRDRINIIDLLALLYLLCSFFNQTFGVIYTIKTSPQSDSSTLELIQYVRFLRILLIFKILRLFSYFSYMQFIKQGIRRILSNFMYNAVLLLLLMVIYAGYGFQLYNGTINEFQSYSYSIIAVWQIITVDNWYVLFTECYGKSDKTATVTFFLSLILMGNYIFLNLFIALVLDGFENLSRDEQKSDGRCENEDENDAEDEFSSGSEDETEDINECKGLDTQDFSQFLQRFKFDPEFEAKVKKRNIPFLEKASHGNRRGTKVAERSKTITDKDINLHLLKTIQIRLTYLEMQYKGLSEKYSFFVFSKKNSFRKSCFFLARSSLFTTIINTMIIVNSIKFGMDTWIDWDHELEDQDLKTTSATFDSIFFAFFLLEFMIKTIAEGLFVSQDSYLRNPFNFMNFLNILGMIVSKFTFDQTLTVFKEKLSILFRLASPIRLIYENPNMKVTFYSLFNSVHRIGNIMITVLLVWVAFAVLGMILFSGRFGYCGDPNAFEISRTQCIKEGRQWSVYPFNFDTLPNALLTLFVVSTLDNWTHILSVAVDSNTEEYVFFYYFPSILSL